MGCASNRHISPVTLCRKIHIVTKKVEEDGNKKKVGFAHGCGADCREG